MARSIRLPVILNNATLCYECKCQTCGNLLYMLTMEAEARGSKPSTWIQHYCYELDKENEE